MIAILDDDLDALDSTVQSILSLGYDPAGFSNPAALFNYLDDHPVQLLLIGESSCSDNHTMRLVDRYHERHSSLPIIVVNPGSSCYDATVGFYTLAQPFTQSTLDRSINAALHQAVSQTEY